MTTAWTAFQIWAKCSHLGAHTSPALPDPHLFPNCTGCMKMGPEFGIYWEHLCQGSDSTPRESSSEPPPLEEQPRLSHHLFSSLPKNICVLKRSFSELQTQWKYDKTPTLVPRKFRFSWHLQQFGLLMRQHSTGTQTLSFSWWDLLLYFPSNDLYNGKLREKTKSCSFLSQPSTEITIRANEVTQHFSSPSTKPTQSSSLNQLFDISAAHRYYGY